MKNIINLNEEIKRMKSLFGEGNLYGNLIDEPKNEMSLVVEQGIGRRLSKVLSKGDTKARNLAKSIKKIDPIRATKFIEAEISGFGAFQQHLNEFRDVWKTILDDADWDYVNEIVGDISRDLKKPGGVEKIKSLFRDDINEFISSLPEEGGIREIFSDLWKLEFYGVKSGISDDAVVIVKKGDETFIHTVKKGDGGEEISTQKISDDGDIITDPNYNKLDSKKEIDDYFEGNTTDGTPTKQSSMGSSKSSDVVKVDPNGKPDNIKGEILSKIEELLEKTKGSTTKSIDDVVKSISKDGKVLIVTDANGNIKIVNSVENVEIDIIKNTDGTYTSELKKLGESDTTPTQSSGGGSGGDTKKPFFDQLKTGGKSSVNAAFQFFRWTFPTLSEGVRLVTGFIPQMRNVYGGWLTGGRFSIDAKRFSWVPKPSGKKSGVVKFLRQTFVDVPETVARLGIEQIALVSIYGTYRNYERGGLKDDESFATMAVADYPESYFFKYHPLTFIGSGLVAIYDEVSDAKTIALTACRKKSENKGEKNLEGPVYKECTESVENFFGRIDDINKALDNLNISDYTNTEEWTSTQKQDFCDDKDNQKTELYKNLDTLYGANNDLEKVMDEIIPDSKGSNFAGKIVGSLNWFLPVGVGDIEGVEDIKNKLLPKIGDDLGNDKINVVKNQLEKMCVNLYNRTNNREDEPDILPSNEPLNTNDTIQPSNGGGAQPGTPEEIKDLYGSVTVEVEVINIV